MATNGRALSPGTNKQEKILSAGRLTFFNLFCLHPPRSEMKMNNLYTILAMPIVGSHLHDGLSTNRSICNRLGEDGNEIK